jgi:cephalosporin hydroxylase
VAVLRRDTEEEGVLQHLLPAFGHLVSNEIPRSSTAVMSLSDRLYTLVRKPRSAVATSHGDGTDISAEEAAKLEKQHHTELGRLFFGHRGRIMQKWVHYLDLYDAYLSEFRQRPVRLLEIGVNRGGSLELWREYFGKDAVIFGVDLNPECAELFEAPNQVRIGSQADPIFLRSVVAEMGTPDIIIDDGSHVAHHQRVSFETLFPLLAAGGIYVIEDMHTAYWRGEWGGGYKRRGTAVELVKQLIDDMHGWWHRRAGRFADRQDITAIHIHDSITFIEKGPREKPRHARVGA